MAHDMGDDKESTVRDTCRSFSMNGNSHPGAVTHKVLLVGGTGVGKTCILRRFVDGEFPSKSKATLGLDFRIKSIRVGEKFVKLQLWDTSGQERFRSMTQSYYRGAAGILLVYDVTDENTMASLSTWLTDIKQHAPEDVEVVLLANKIDLSEERIISKEAGEEFARQCGMIYYETSAVENKNIIEAFQKLAETVSSRERKRRDTVLGLMEQIANGQKTQPEKKKFNCSC